MFRLLEPTRASPNFLRNPAMGASLGWSIGTGKESPSEETRHNITDLNRCALLETRIWPVSYPTVSSEQAAVALATFRDDLKDGKFLHLARPDSARLEVPSCPHSFKVNTLIPNSPAIDSADRPLVYQRRTASHLNASSFLQGVASPCFAAVIVESFLKAQRVSVKSGKLQIATAAPS